MFPQAVEVDNQGRIRVNPAAIQLALDPANPAGVRVEEDGYELRWVGKREAYHQAFVPTHKIVSAAHSQSKDWDNTGNLLIKGDNLDALKLLRQSYFGQVKLIHIDPPYNTQRDQFIYRDDFSVKQTEVLTTLGYSAENIDYIKMCGKELHPIDNQAVRDLSLYAEPIMPVDSDIERDTVDESQLASVTVFAKLPRIDIPTPLGKYNPDFGYAVHRQGDPQALYLVVETKGYDNRTDIEGHERFKIDSAKRFFEALRAEGVRVRFESKINGETLGGLVAGILQA